MRVKSCVQAAVLDNQNPFLVQPRSGRGKSLKLTATSGRRQGKNDEGQVIEGNAEVIRFFRTLGC
jgi:hypothetical protein